jgi:hypothetical protein
LGRPAQVVSPEQEEIARLAAENRDLRQQRRVAEVREELARVMPYVLHPPGDDSRRAEEENLPVGQASSLPLPANSQAGSLRHDSKTTGDGPKKGTTFS